MKIRESGMPAREMWETFFDPIGVLAAVGLDGRAQDAAEFGCGYGTFTIPAARIIKGVIHAFDIEPEMIRMTSEAAAENGLRNVRAVLRDFMSAGSGLPDASVDHVMLFNTLHLENPADLLSEAKRILRAGGKAGIIHWNHDPRTPRGPSMDIRPKPEQCIDWARGVGFADPLRCDLKPYHYGLVLTKREAR